MERSVLTTSFLLLIISGCGDGVGPGSAEPLDNKILFAAGTTAETAQIFVMNPDGSQTIQITNGPGFRGSPVGSPDGTKVAFARRDELGDSDIYVIDADGSGLTQVTSGPALDQRPDWSPDGTRIIFERSNDLYTVHVDGSSLSQLTSTLQISEGSPAWSPDGARIALTGYDGALEERDIYLMNADGSGLVRLPLAGEDLDPAWSPDGSRLAFSNQIEPGIRILYTVNADGSGLTPITSGEVRDFSPDWSPDGTRLVFGRLLLTPGERFQDIYLLNLADGSVVRLTTSSASAFTPSWARVR